MLETGSVREKRLKNKTLTPYDDFVSHQFQIPSWLQFSLNFLSSGLSPSTFLPSNSGVPPLRSYVFVKKRAQFALTSIGEAAQENLRLHCYSL